MDLQVEVVFVDDHGNVLAPPGIPPGASSAEPSIRKDVASSDGRRLTYPVPEGATQVRIFLPRERNS